MKRHISPSGALSELADQHGRLRDMMERCEELADALDAGNAEPDALLREVARLRTAFDAHNRFEEQLLRPMLVDADWMGAVRASVMVEEHIEEHRSMRQQMGSPTTAELRAVIASLRAHLQAEERVFLSGKVLRDDLV
jgi:iron-sulfur cluster repair protein YtfE (RIC family)